MLVLPFLHGLHQTTSSTNTSIRLVCTADVITVDDMTALLHILTNWCGIFRVTLKNILLQSGDHRFTCHHNDGDKSIHVALLYEQCECVNKIFLFIFVKAIYNTYLLRQNKEEDEIAIMRPLWRQLQLKKWCQQCTYTILRQYGGSVSVA